MVTVYGDRPLEYGFGGRDGHAFARIVGFGQELYIGAGISVGEFIALAAERLYGAY